MKLKTLLKVIPGCFNINVYKPGGTDVAYSGLKWDLPSDFEYLDREVNVIFGVTKHGDKQTETSYLDDQHKATRLSIRLKPSKGDS